MESGAVIIFKYRPNSYVQESILATFVPKVGEYVSLEMMRKEKVKGPYGEWDFKREIVCAKVKRIEHSFDVWNRLTKQTVEIELED